MGLLYKLFYYLSCGPPLRERERERGACVWESKLNKKNKRGRERETWGCSVEEKN